MVAMTLHDIQGSALQLPDAERAALAAELLASLPATLWEDDEGIAEARRRSQELAEDATARCSWEDIRRGLGR